MGLKPDSWIRKMALEQQMIEPFVDGQVRDGVISYGLSSYGYDIRVADEFKIFQPEITAAKLSDVQCAYVAGVLDAKGQVGYTTSGQQERPSLALVVASDDRQMLERLQAALGTGSVRQPDDGRSELVVNKAADVQYILSQVWPYLTHRRDMASRALAELKSNKSIVVDPKHFDADSFVDFKGDVCIIPPNSFALSRTVEYFRVPRSTLTVCVGKSSYARCGIIVNVTPFEPE
jgi:deoxycytidine triphosphate deaminase